MGGLNGLFFRRIRRDWWCVILCGFVVLLLSGGFVCFEFFYSASDAGAEGMEEPKMGCASQLETGDTPGKGVMFSHEKI